MFALLRRLAVLSCLPLAFPLCAQSFSPSAEQGLGNRPHVDFARLPLTFEKNVGQASPEADYLVRSGNLLTEISPAGMRLSLLAAEGDSQKLSISLVGASRASKAVSGRDLGARVNYLLGANTSAWHTGVHQYERVSYSEIYRGIDLTYYGNPARLEHDFIVHPGAEPSQLHLRVDGPTQPRLTKEGSLDFALRGHNVALRKPVAYQTIDGQRRAVPVDFILEGNNIHFRLGAYDATQDLVIDPVLDYSTFLGDASIYVRAIAVDKAGNTYITGEAPVTFGANAGTGACKSCTSGANKRAAYVTKLNATGTAILYSTFFGGSVTYTNSPSADQVRRLQVDGNGNAIVTGRMDSSDFPLKNAIPSGVSTARDGFVVSLTPDGAGMNFSSRLGGSSASSTSASLIPNALAIDSGNNIYVAGSSQSTYLAVTPGALNESTPGPNSAVGFLLKLTQAGAVDFSAILGKIGNVSEVSGPTGLAIDKNGIIYVTGSAGGSLTTGPGYTTTWPTTVGAYQRAIISPSDNAPFVMRVSADGKTILSSTLVGTGMASAMALTPSHEVLLAGTAGYNFPVTDDAYNKEVSTPETGFSGPLGFFAKVSEDGSRLIYSSLFGPKGSTPEMNGIAQDANENVWLAGTVLYPLPTLVHPLQSVAGSFTPSGFVAKFDPSMQNLLFSTYVKSASGPSQINGFVIDSLGKAHVAGVAAPDFPTTTGAAIPSVNPPPNFTSNYGFAAQIDASTSGPGLCLRDGSGAAAQVGKVGNGSFTLESCGDGPLNIKSLQLTSSVFAITSTGSCIGSLPSGTSCTGTYSFKPSVAGPVTAAVQITSDAPMGPNSVRVGGTGTAPIVYLAQGSNLFFQPSVVGAAPSTATILVSNRGTAPLIVDTTRTTLTGAAFSIAGTTCDREPIRTPPNNNTFFACSYQVRLDPSQVGSITGSITIYTDDPLTPSVTVNIFANVLATYPVPTIARLSVPTLSLDDGPGDVTILGTGFFPLSSVSVNGIKVPTKTQTSQTLVVTVDPAMLGHLGEFPVQVSNPAPGNGSNVVSLTSYRRLPITATTMITDPISKRFYAAIPASAATNPNTIVSIDPTTASFGTPIPVKSNPTSLAISDDGHYLYVAYYNSGASTPAPEIQRIDLAKGAVDRTFALPSEVAGIASTTGIYEMHVVPGSPQLLVASLQRDASPGENGVVLFNDSGIVQYIPNNFSWGNFSLNSFTFTSGTNVYGFPVAPFYFNSASVSSSGITPVVNGGNVCCTKVFGYIVVSDGAKLYTNAGEVWDPKTKSLLGRYDLSSYLPSVLPDADTKRTYFLDPTFQVDTAASRPAILSYDSSTYTRSGALNFGGTIGTGIANLARWDNNGLAFLAGGIYTDDAPITRTQLILLRSDTLTGVATVDPLIASITPSTVIAGSGATTITVNGAGFLAGSTVLWNGAARPTTVVSDAQLKVALTAADLAVPATITVSVRNADGKTSSALTFSVASASFTLSSANLNFEEVLSGASAQQSVTFKNTGTVGLSNIDLSITGTDAAEMTATKACPAILASGATCDLTVTFAPKSLGSKSATLTVNASGASSQSVKLTGTGVGPDFRLPPPSGSSSATVSSGQPATFTFNVSATGGFTGTVSMSCTNLPANASCAFTPSTFTTGATPVAVSLSIATQQTVTAYGEPQHSVFGNAIGNVKWAFLLMLPLLSRRTRQTIGKTRGALLVAVLFAGGLMLNGCSGGGASSSSGSKNSVLKTAPGTYTVSVVAASGTGIHSTDVTLVVQ